MNTNEAFLLLAKAIAILVARANKNYKTVVTVKELALASAINDNLSCAIGIIRFAQEQLKEGNISARDAVRFCAESLQLTI